GVGPMAASRRATVRLWRWRCNPLRRGSDVVEAWVVLLGWVFALVGGLLVGVMAADAVERDAERQRAERRQVPAVLVEDANDRLPERAATDYRVWATVRWAAPDGSTHRDEARVPSKTPAGSKITVWTDKNSEVTAEPLSDGETRVHAILGGVLTGAGAGGVVLCAAWAVRLGMDRRRLAQWAAEWELIDTRKGWKTG
ncbi:Rv1733c family protein, partial [Streptomyces curacoi]